MFLYEDGSIGEKLRKVRVKMNESQVHHLVMHQAESIACMYSFVLFGILFIRI
jgi:hypothetical protein